MSKRGVGAVLVILFGSIAIIGLGIILFGIFFYTPSSIIKQTQNPNQSSDGTSKDLGNLPGQDIRPIRGDTNLSYTDSFLTTNSSRKFTGGGGGGGGSNGDIHPTVVPKEIILDYEGYDSSFLSYYNTVTLNNFTNDQIITLIAKNISLDTFYITSLPSKGILKDFTSGITITPSVLPYPLLNHEARVLFQSNKISGPDSISFVISRPGRGVSEEALVTIEISSNHNPTFPESSMIPPINDSYWTNPKKIEPFTDLVDKSTYWDYMVEAYQKHIGNDDINKVREIDDPTKIYDLQFGNYQYVKRMAFWNITLGNIDTYHLAQYQIQNPDYINMSLNFLDILLRYYTYPDSNKTYLRRSDGPFMMQGYLWIYPHLTEAQKIRGKNLILNIEKYMESNSMPPYSHAHETGAGAAGLGPATTIRVIDHLYNSEPLPPGKDDRTQYSQSAWNAWYENFDFYEDSYNYNILTLNELIIWFEIMPPQSKAEMLNDPNFKTFIRRFLQQSTPFGFIANYGDGGAVNGANGNTVAFFEYMATAYKTIDPELSSQLKWVAQKTFVFNAERTPPNENNGADIWMKRITVDGLQSTYLYSDDSIQANAPSFSSLHNTRQQIQTMTDQDRKSTGYPSIVLPQKIPNKMILRNGWEKDSFYAIVQLLPAYGHGHCDTGAIDFLMTNGSILLQLPGYGRSSNEYHNTMSIIGPRNRCQDIDFGNQQTEIIDFKDTALSTYSVIKTKDYTGNPVTFSRRIFYSKEGIIWASDKLTAQGSITGMVGPTWNTLTIYGDRGSNWFNTAFQTLPSQNVGGNYYLNQWAQNQWDLLIVFPNPTGIPTVDYVGNYDGSNQGTNQRLRVWDKKYTSLSAGQEEQFDSVLIPHSPNPDVGELAINTKIMLSSSNASIVKITTSSSSGTYMGYNDLGEQLTFDSISTDAKTFYIKIKDGSIQHFDVFGATNLKVSDNVLFSRQERSDLLF